MERGSFGKRIRSIHSNPVISYQTLALHAHPSSRHNTRSVMGLGYQSLPKKIASTRECIRRLETSIRDDTREIALHNILIDAPHP